jgi:hypothetical protein
MCQSCQSRGNKLYRFRVLGTTYKACIKTEDCIERRKKLMAKIWS